MQQLTVDIIIPTYKPDAKLEKLIKGLLRQTHPVQNIFIMHTKSSPFPKSIVALDERISVHEIEPKTFDHGGTRKAAAAMSKTDLFVCMTQDAVPADIFLLENLSAAFADPKVACCFARQLPNKDCGIIEKYTRTFNYPENSSVRTKDSIREMGIKAFFCSNVCAAYRRVLYEEQGGFVGRAIFNEDMIMAGTFLQAGYKCVYEAEAKVVHSHNYSATQQLKRNFDLAVSQTEHPEIFAHIRSESEGIRLVKKTAYYLLKIKKPWLLVPLIWKSGFKFIGFKLGQQYTRLPQRMVVALSSNPKYWCFKNK